MKAFVISLKRRHDRAEKARSEAEIIGLPYEIVDAYDNHDYRSEQGVDWDRLHRELPFSNDNWGVKFMASEVCCYHSHMEVYRRIVAQDLPSAFILEDDFCLVESPFGFHEVAHELEFFPGWSHCCLHNCLPGTNTNHAVIGQPHTMFYQVRETPLIAIGYAVTQEFCRHMLATYGEMDAPVDHLICRVSRDPERIFLQTTGPICGDSLSPSAQE